MSIHHPRMWSTVQGLKLGLLGATSKNSCAVHHYGDRLVPLLIGTLDIDDGQSRCSHFQHPSMSISGDIFLQAWWHNTIT